MLYVRLDTNAKTTTCYFFELTLYLIFDVYNSIQCDSFYRLANILTTTAAKLSLTKSQQNNYIIFTNSVFYHQSDERDCHEITNDCCNVTIDLG